MPRKAKDDNEGQMKPMKKAKLTHYEKLANKHYKQAEAMQKKADKFHENADKTQKAKMEKYYKMLDQVKHLRLAGDAFKRINKNPEDKEINETEANEHISRVNEIKESLKRQKSKTKMEEEEEEYKKIKEAIAKKKGKKDEMKQEMKEEIKEDIKVPEFPAKIRKADEEDLAKKSKALKTIAKFGEMAIAKNKALGEIEKMGIEKEKTKRKMKKEEKRQAEEREMMAMEDVRASAIEKVERPKEKGFKFMKEAGAVMKRVAELEKAKPKKPEPKKRAKKLKPDQTQMTAFAKKKDEEESESDEEKPNDIYGFKKSKKMKFYN